MTDEIIEIRVGVTVNRIRQSINRNGVEVLLTRQTFAILLLIAKAEHGVTPQRLFDAIYADRIHGGPATGAKAVATRRCNLNSRLAPLGLHITSNGFGRAGLYTLEVPHG